jgi:hypothetical protein
MAHQPSRAARPNAYVKETDLPRLVFARQAIERHADRGRYSAEPDKNPVTVED